MSVQVVRIGGVCVAKGQNRGCLRLECLLKALLKILNQEYVLVGIREMGVNKIICY